MIATPRKALHATVFAAALVASVATSTVPAWEALAESTALEVTLGPSGSASFDVVIRGNRAAFEQAGEPGAANVTLVATLTAEDEGDHEATLAVAVLPEEARVTAALSAAHPVELTAQGAWAPDEACTIERERGPSGCTVTLRATLQNGAGTTVHGTLQAFVQLYGPDESSDESTTGTLEVGLVPVAP